MRLNQEVLDVVDGLAVSFPSSNEVIELCGCGVSSVTVVGNNELSCSLRIAEIEGEVRNVVTILGTGKYHGEGCSALSCYFLNLINGDVKNVSSSTAPESADSVEVPSINQVRESLSLGVIEDHDLLSEYRN